MKKLLALLILSTVALGAASDKFIENDIPGGDVIVNLVGSGGTKVEVSRFSPPLGNGARSIGTVGAVANSQGALSGSDFTTPANSHWWSLNSDSNGSSGGTPINLTQNGAPAFNGVGFFGREALMDFDGVDNYLSSANAAFNVTTTSFSTGGWFKRSSSSDVYLIGKWNDSTNRQYLLYLGSDGSVVYNLSTTGSTTTTSINIPNIGNTFIGQWTHFVAVFDNTNDLQKLYINGQLAGSIAATGNLFAGNGTFAIGAYQNGGSFSLYRPLQAQDIFFTSDVLSDTQINAIYSHRFTNTTQVAAGHVLAASSFPLTSLTNKAVFWNLSDLTDGSGNGKTLTNVGSTTFTGLDIFGSATTAVFNGTSQAFTSADAMFNPGDVPFAYGGWFAAENWTASQSIMGNVGVSNVWRIWSDSFGVYCYTGTGAPTIGRGLTKPVNGSWHHLASVYSKAKNQWTCYIDGMPVASYYGSNTAAGGTFSIGSNQGSSQWFKGRAQSAFFMLGEYTDQDIRKLASSKITHSKNISSINQAWFAGRLREDGKVGIPFSLDWIVDQNANALFLDFKGQNPGDSVILKSK